MAAKLSGLAGRLGTPARLLAAVLVATGLSLLLRAPTFSYAGAHTQAAFNDFAFSHIWSYSDVASLFFRDRLWRHPAPYFDYRLEYPVVTGAFVWVASLVPRSVGAYLGVTAAMLGACGAATVALMRSIPRANPWLLALSPTVVLYAVFNWDLLALALTVAALALFVADRLRPAGAVLALATWAKVFPVVFLAIVVIALIGRRRGRHALGLVASFTLVSVAVNLPVALELHGGGVRLRHAWSYFITLNTHRRGLSVWSLGPHLTTAQLNLASGLLAIAGVGLALAIVWRHRTRVPAGLLLAPAGLACLAALFAVNKVNSPQYSLWVVALLALCGAPIALVLAFGVFDVAFFGADFTSLFLAQHAPTVHDVFHARVVHPAVAVRELFLIGIYCWSLWLISVRAREASV